MLAELLANAWDEDGVTDVQAYVIHDSDKRIIKLQVVDNAPAGFADLSHAYTIYAESYKKDHAEKRGRFNMGDKLIACVAEEMDIITTKGRVQFYDDERRIIPTDRRAHGSEITVIVKGTKADYQSILDGINRLQPPVGINTTVNNKALIRRSPVTMFNETLPTVIGEDLRPSRRQTSIEVLSPPAGEDGWIYEMGIPVVTTGDKYDINIGQKVPLNQDRDNVTPSFLKLVRALVLNHVHDKLTQEDFTKPWISVAVQDENVDTKAVNTYLTAKYGEKRAIFDPTAPESMSRLMAQGVTIIHGRQENKATWGKIHEGGLALPAGKVLPTRIETLEGHVAEKDWTMGMATLAKNVARLSNELLDKRISVGFVNDIGSTVNACYGSNRITFNVGRLGFDWCDHGFTQDVLRLVIHELAHDYSGDHLSDDYYRALCKLGAKLALIAANNSTGYPWQRM